ncbi:SCO2322 family protein [Streptomyces sp. NBC_00704]|uniref:SCO2322 family protein n=1 Tax=Streptomyces sp. NBC_00704 TaxID=2975809 RepID=UPI002E3192B8|nr:SCO2322 family protein [Streptomyces sp. NBC_00704]
MKRRSAALVLAALLLTLTGAAQSAQATGYRYWSFWDRTADGWTYATQGPSTARPSDGDVEGFRFAVSADSQDATRPRGAVSFAAICAKTPPRDGMKRVALVIDFGTAADAPDGEAPPSPRTACARVASGATTAEALAAVARPLRYDANALLCAIAGYPRSGCGEQVATDGTSTRKPASADAKAGADGNGGGEDGGPSVGLYAGAAAVAVLGAAAVWQARRRRND